MSGPAGASSPSLRDPPGALNPCLPRSFYERPSVELAPALLGRLLLRQTPEGLAGGVIVEVEAYAGPHDRASHARAGLTRRTAPMFGPAGHAYVYLVYGMHCCLNIVSETDGRAGAVLIRALEPLVGASLQRARRGPAPGPDALLCAGPARLCRALAVDRSLDGHDLTAGTGLWISDPEPGVAERIHAAGVAAGPRIGVAYAGPEWADRAWRFGVRGHPALSRPFARDGVADGDSAGGRAGARAATAARTSGGARAATAARTSAGRRRGAAAGDAAAGDAA